MAFGRATKKVSITLDQHQVAEIQRLASHLVWLATHILDLGATSVMLYCFRDREHIIDMFEMISGQRMMTTYIRPGGVWRDVPEEFYDTVDAFTEMFPKRIAQYDGLLTKNPLYIEALKKVIGIKSNCFGSNSFSPKRLPYPEPQFHVCS